MKKENIIKYYTYQLDQALRLGYSQEVLEVEMGLLKEGEKLRLAQVLEGNTNNRTNSIYLKRKPTGFVILVTSSDGTVVEQIEIKDKTKAYKSLRQALKIFIEL